MPPQRRMKLLLAIAFTVLFLFLYYSGEAGKIQDQPFYRSTVQAMEARKKAASLGTQGDGKPGDDQITQPIPKAQPESGTKENNEDMVEIPIAGRTKMQISKNGNNAAKQSEQGAGSKEVEDHGDAKAELNSILKRSPVIIFSKSYCPFSKKAKSILLTQYSIVPAPSVVELDLDSKGSDLQALLGESTGRRTVPNILVNGKSIGGGDEIAELDHKNELTSTLRSLGGKWIHDVSRRESGE